MGDAMKTIADPMTEEEADAWRRSLMEWIAKYHPHLANREEQWKEWDKRSFNSSRL